MRKLKQRVNFRVSEIFTSIQGEGPSSGTYANFIRFAGCNLRCSFCDTAYAWAKYNKKDEIINYTCGDVIEKLNVKDCFLTIFTGGEPLLHQKEILILMEAINIVNPLMRFEIETSASLDMLVSLGNYPNLKFNISPKLSNSNNEEAWAINENLFDDVFPKIRDKVCFKFVVTNCVDDLDEIKDFCNCYNIPNNKVWLMPEGVTEIELALKTKWLMPYCVTNHFNFSPRLHVIAWGNVRGV